MPQTVLAFLAMLIVTMLSLSQQQTMLLAYELMLNDEMEVMAAAISMQAMEYISQREFDAAVAGTNSVANPNELQDWPFTAGNSCSLQGPLLFCTDLDDFHQMTADTLEFVGRDDTSPFRFTVTADVAYVDPALNPDSTVSYETYAKLISVSVRDVTDIMLQPITLSRLIVCEPADGCL